MQNKFWLQIAVLLIGLHSATTYAAGASANGSLWGTIDQPVAPIQQIEQQQQAAQAEVQRIENEKTICELLTLQPTLDTDQANAAKVKDALQRAYSAAAPDYKMLLVSTDAANGLYAKYRDLYIKTYCLNGSKQ